jgi:neutral ceramidase
VRPAPRRNPDSVLRSVRSLPIANQNATKAALIGADQGGLPEGVWEAASKQIATELNCPVENIVMSATHTHSGWGPRGFPGMRELRPDAGANHPPPPIVGQILDAVRQAKAKLQAARVGYGSGKSCLNVNRDAVDGESHLWTQAPNLEGPSDKTVAVIEFLAAGGEPIAVYMN